MSTAGCRLWTGPESWACWTESKDSQPDCQADLLAPATPVGALSLPRGAVDGPRGRKRHPTVGDDVVIYSNATILGEKAVIGARSIIGGNVWITGPVPPDTKVLLENPELIYIGNNSHHKGAG